MHVEKARPATRKPTPLAFIVLSCLVAALALAAADDITTGSEPSYAQEWLMLAFAAAWFLAAGTWAWRRETIRTHKDRLMGRGDPSALGLVRAGDSRPSLEARYPDHEADIRAVSDAAAAPERGPRPSSSGYVVVDLGYGIGDCAAAGRFRSTPCGGFQGGYLITRGSGLALSLRAQAEVLPLHSVGAQRGRGDILAATGVRRGCRQGSRSNLLI